MRVFSCAALSLVLLGAGLLWAGDNPPPKQSDSEIRGTVKKMDAQNGTITLTTSEGQDREFKLNEQTRFVGKNSTQEEGGNQQANRRGGEQANCTGIQACMSRLHEGSEVVLLLDKDADQPTIQEIRLQGRG